MFVFSLNFKTSWGVSLRKPCPVRYFIIVFAIDLVAVTVSTYFLCRSFKAILLVGILYKKVKL